MKTVQILLIAAMFTLCACGINKDQQDIIAATLGNEIVCTPSTEDAAIVTCTITKVDFGKLTELKTNAKGSNVKSFNMQYKDGESNYDMVHETAVFRQDVQQWIIESVHINEVKFHKIVLSDADGKTRPAGAVILKFE